MHVQSKPKLPSNQVALDSGEGNNEDANKSDQDKGARKTSKPGKAEISPPKTASKPVSSGV